MPLPRNNPDLSAAELSTARGARPTWQAADPGAVKCDDYQHHRSEHRRSEGRWRCWTCHPIGGRP